MAVNAIVNLKAGIWKRLTDGAATTITAIHRGGGTVILQAVAGNNPPGPADIRGLPIEKGKDGHMSGFLKKAITDMTHTGSADEVFGLAENDAALYIDTD